MKINLYHNNQIEITNLDGSLECEDCPSIINIYGVFWYKKHALHRLDGPAVIYSKYHHNHRDYPDGRFYINGREYNKKSFEDVKNNFINNKLNGIH